MKLAVGTAQFGLEYGVSNQNGQVSESDVDEILYAAKKAGVITLDTAANYGNSEQSLGKAGVAGFEVVTKFGALPDKSKNIKSWVFEQLERSLTRLKLDRLYGYLLHYPNDLLGFYGESIYEALLDAKAQGILENIGISIYAPNELDNLLDRFDFDIVQAPMNILDRRLDSSGWLQRLEKSNTEVHIRSVFLQGLLLMNGSERPDYFKKWDAIFQEYDEWLTAANLSALEACTSFIQQFAAVQKIIVGVTSLSQLEGIIDAMSSAVATIPPKSLFSEDISLINPAKWSI